MLSRKTPSVLIVGTAFAFLMSVVSSVTPAAAAETEATESIVVVVNGTSLSDVGTAASLVAAGTGDAVVFAESADALGEDAAAVLTDQQPDRVVVVGGTSAVSGLVESELRQLVDGVFIERLAGRDRIETAALAARRALGSGDVSTVVIANGWSLPDVGTAASAVATGTADAVLYSDRRTLGHPTSQALRSLRPNHVLIAGGTAAINERLELVIADESSGAEVVRLGGETRLDTAAKFAERALQAGANTAVMANGWSETDVGVAATLAAALGNTAVLYANGNALDASSLALLNDYPPHRILVVQSESRVGPSLFANSRVKFADADLTYFDSSIAATRYALGFAPAHIPQRALDRYLAVAADSSFACAIKTDHTITCWGSNLEGKASPPLGDFTAIATGFSHACAIEDDRTVQCWGYDGDAGLVDAPGGHFTAITVGWSHSCGIEVDGSVACWGDDRRDSMSDVPEGTFTAIDAGRNHTCAIRTDRTVTCWVTLGE